MLSWLCLCSLDVLTRREKLSCKKEAPSFRYFSSKKIIGKAMGEIKEKRGHSISFF
jgi:hypothetical protein